VSTRAPGEVLHFMRGEPIAVDVGEIERALSDLWKQASSSASSATGAQSAENPHDAPVSRAALWNVVIPARGRDALAATKHLVDELAPALPTRTITLCLDDGRTGGGPLEATIESNVVAQPGGARTVYSEEIMVAGPPGAEAHFGALVRALQVPGVPTATFWMDPTMPASLLTRELLPMTSRLVLDTTACLRPKHLFDFERLATTAHPLPIADIAWLRLGPLRSLFAGMFDPPVGGAPLQRATRLAITHRPGSDAAALLMLAWIGVLLDWRPRRSVQTSEGGLRFDFDRGGATVTGTLVPTDGPCGKSGMLAMELAVGAERYAIRRTALDQAVLETPRVPSKPVMLDAHSDAELCVAALGSRGRDPLFARCLAYARQLWSLEPDSAGSRR
jgi:glucose-6-phosphate dehydrogenase assembly protein OpcA